MLKDKLLGIAFDQTWGRCLYRKCSCKLMEIMSFESHDRDAG